ncbi:hypothetical protein C8F04DRAFT_1273247 [Mycena alexandri]|uniref:Uncharacterized protein n=1 Tax=Mycena alexandri TaxID=1745969 RepID=A0AAD6S7V7_9AGAR|nr:hypothetical protein C8F04DRAFT_1273247 [Mycena alexandri]
MSTRRSISDSAEGLLTGALNGTRDMEAATSFKDHLLAVLSLHDALRATVAPIPRYSGPSDWQTDATLRKVEALLRASDYQASSTSSVAAPITTPTPKASVAVNGKRPPTPTPVPHNLRCACPFKFLTILLSAQCKRKHHQRARLPRLGGASASPSATISNNAGAAACPNHLAPAALPVPLPVVRAHESERHRRRLFRRGTAPARTPPTPQAPAAAAGWARWRS